jgi:hypothetical protein
MANTNIKISQLNTANSPLNANDLFVIVQNGETKKVTRQSTGMITSVTVTNIVTLTQSEYDAIAEPDEATLYIVTGA